MKWHLLAYLPLIIVCLLYGIFGYTSLVLLGVAVMCWVVGVLMRG